jgi:hypothetical protein
MKVAKLLMKGDIKGAHRADRFWNWAKKHPLQLESGQKVDVTEVNMPKYSQELQQPFHRY